MNTRLLRFVSVGTIFVLFITLVYYMFPTYSVEATIETFTTPGSSSWTAPAGVTSVSVDCYGGGGGGGRGDGTGVSGGGGGGGAFARVVLSVTPGNSYNYTVGAGGAGAAGGNINGDAGTDSTFNNTSCVAKAGLGGIGASNGGAGGTGGLAASSTGDFTGNGGSGGSGAGATTGGGGGEGAFLAPGTDGDDGSAGGAGGSSAGLGGDGGNGGTATNNGADGSSPGGAGGGGGEKSGGSENGGSGARGEIRLTYTADTSPPTPNPTSFATAPTATTTNIIRMIATTVTDPSTPVEYFFTATTSTCGADVGTGGTNSSWQTSAIYNDTGLQTNKCYGYMVTTRDSAGNTGATSTASTTYTRAAVPGAMTYSAVGASTITLTNAENGNPASNPTTNFAVYATSTDARWHQVYVTAAAGTSSSQTWLTDAQIDSMVLTGLIVDTRYDFQVVARNADLIITSTSTLSGTTTNGDVTAPTPNPPYFTTPPNNDASNQLSMTSVTVTDDTDPTPNYYFTASTESCTAGHEGTGFTDSGWQVGASYIDTGLDVNKCYTYKVTTRDASGNYSATSTGSTTYTSANVPGQLTFSSVSGTSFGIINNANGNPTTNPTTEFAVYATTSDATWNQRYVDSGGNPTATRTWLSHAQINAVTLTGLEYNTEYRFVVVARNANNDETASSTLSATTTLPDTVAPTPNPPTFEQVSGIPTNASASQIDMTANAVTDPSTPVSYNFGVTTGSCGADFGSGGTNSGWQSADTTYSDTGLQPNQCYAYTVTARDSLNNTTATSTASSTYTSANIPGLMTLASSSKFSLTLLNNENSNPSVNPTTQFAVFIQSTSPLDSSHDAQYIDASGNPSASAVWLTDAQIDNLVVSGLNASTTYNVQVKARNADGDETSFTSATPLSTQMVVLNLIRMQGVRLQGSRLR